MRNGFISKIRKSPGTAVLILSIALLTAFGFFSVYRSQTATNRESQSEKPDATSPVYMVHKDGKVDPNADNSDGFWKTAKPSVTGLSDKGVSAYLDLCKLTGADAALVVHNGTIVGEWYSARYAGSEDAMSSTKSVTGLLVGMMQDQGLLSIDDPVGKYLPEWRKGSRGKVTIRELLTQTGGFQTRSDAKQSVGFAQEKNSFVRGLTPNFEPGTRWAYSNEGVQLLSPVLEAASGERLDRYAMTHLFRPLGMEHTHLHTSGKENDIWTYADMTTTPRDFARIGMMILGRGVFKGKQIVSEKYLEESFAPSPENPGYGYLWWLYGNPVVVVAARGYLSTDMVIVPGSRLILVRMQAPVAAFSGKDESNPYSEFEQRFISMMLGKTNSDEAQALLDEVKMQRGEHSPETIFNEAISFSQKGDARKVLSLLLPLADHTSLGSSLTAKISDTIALQYIRMQQYQKAGKYLDRAEANGIESIGGFWTTSHRDMRNIVSTDGR